MKKEFSVLLSKYRPQLVDEIDPENGLLNELISSSVISRRQAKQIEVLGDPYKKSEMLIDILHKRPDDDYEKFCDALIKTNQQVIVSQYLKPTDEEPADVEFIQETQLHNETVPASNVLKPELSKTSTLYVYKTQTSKEELQEIDQVSSVAKSNLGTTLDSSNFASSSLLADQKVADASLTMEYNQSGSTEISLENSPVCVISGTTLNFDEKTEKDEKTFEDLNIVSRDVFSDVTMSENCPSEKLEDIVDSGRVSQVRSAEVGVGEDLSGEFLVHTQLGNADVQLELEESESGEQFSQVHDVSFLSETSELHGGRPSVKQPQTLSIVTSIEIPTRVLHVEAQTEAGCTLHVQLDPSETGRGVFQVDVSSYQMPLSGLDENSEKIHEHEPL